MVGLITEEVLDGHGATIDVSVKPTLTRSKMGESNCRMIGRGEWARWFPDASVKTEVRKYGFPSPLAVLLHYVLERTNT
jgi:hypothetical protein